MNITVQGDLLVNVYIHGQPYLPEQAQITSDHIGRVVAQEVAQIKDRIQATSRASLNDAE